MSTEVETIYARSTKGYLVAQVQTVTKTEKGEVRSIPECRYVYDLQDVADADLDAWLKRLYDGQPGLTCAPTTDADEIIDRQTFYREALEIGNQLLERADDDETRAFVEEFELAVKASENSEQGNDRG